MKSTLLTAIILFTFNYISFSQTGILDSSFASFGKDTTDFYHQDDVANSVAVTANDKILAAGTIVDMYGRNNIAIVRYKSNGGVDSSFGQNGKVTTLQYNRFGTKEGAMTVQADGKILIGGSYNFISDYDFAVIRYNSNGSIDSSFGQNGFFTQIITGTIKAVLIQKDGKILIAGNSLIERLTNNGVLDSTFGTNGQAHYDADNGNYVSLSLQGDRIIVSATYNLNMNIERFTKDGARDYSFGNSGSSSINFSSFSYLNSETHSSVVLNDNKILICGDAYSDNVLSAFALAKLDTSGILDTSFGNSGLVVTHIDGDDDCGAHSIKIQADNKILLSGFSSFSRDFALARYSSTGSLDTSFGIFNTGTIATDFYISDDLCYAMDLQSNGKIILCGSTKGFSFPSYNNFALARYNNDVILPVNFASFTAAKNNQTVILNWNACNEINNKGFYIERGSTGHSWTDVGFISAKDLSKGCNDYSFIDSKPLPGNNFYRIKQIDNDGKILLSKTVNVIFNQSSISLSPNPAKNILTIKGLGNNNSVLCITDASGKAVSKMQTVNNAFDWNIQNLSSGNYFVVVYQNNKLITSIKFIKQ